MDCFYAILDNERLLLVSGPDTLTFLQGQTSCDTTRVTPGQAIPGAYCTPQGRVICDFLLSQPGDQQFALRMRRDIIDRSAATFGKYIVFSRAELSAATEHWQVVALWGAGAATAVADLTGAAPAAQFACSGDDGVVAVQTDREGQQFELYVDRDRHAELLARLPSLARQRAPAHWQLLQIEAGIGRLEQANVEAFVPQMLNFDITGHVSFTKGCYTGQEVVARLHYRGKAKRRMYLAATSSPVDSAAGTLLYAPGKPQSVGQVVNSVNLPEGQSRLLVVAAIDAAASELHLVDANGPLLALLNLPYELEGETA